MLSLLQTYNNINKDKLMVNVQTRNVIMTADEKVLKKG